MTKKIVEDLFDESDGKPVICEGRLVHAIAYRHVAKPGRFIVRFIEYVADPIQALAIDIDPGTLLVDDSESPKMILRLDTSPDVVEVQYRPSSEESRLVFFNEWIREDGSILSWLTHAGMLVEEDGNKMTLRCSDGRGEPTFDDLVVEIEFLGV